MTVPPDASADQHPDLGSQLGFVLVEWNQASGQPDVADGTFSRIRDDVESQAIAARTRTAAIGRRERYTVAVVLAIADKE